MTFYSVSAVIGYGAGYKRLKKYNNNNENSSVFTHTNVYGDTSEHYSVLLLGLPTASACPFHSGPRA